MTAEPKQDPKAGAKAEAQRKSITINFEDDSALFEQITKLAKEDDRTPATWLRRFLRDMCAKHYIKSEGKIT